MTETPHETEKKEIRIQPEKKPRSEEKKDRKKYISKTAAEELF